MMATKVPGWFERVLLPQMSELKGEIKALDAKVGGFESKVEGEFRGLHSEIGRIDEKIDSLDKRLETKIDGLDKRMDVTQRVAVIEEKMRELETKH
jgi:predicted RNase H-like nuclease (RuvC/YqgF family)